MTFSYSELCDGRDSARRDVSKSFAIAGKNR